MVDLENAKEKRTAQNVSLNNASDNDFERSDRNFINPTIISPHSAHLRMRSEG